MRTFVFMSALLLAAGCGSEPEPMDLPTMGTPASAVTWPSSPDGLSTDVEHCVRDYRQIAGEGLPSQAEGQAFSAWYTGPFQTWTQRYNDVRARCDLVFEGLDAQSATAQVVLAAQSYLHERAGEEAMVHEDEPQMFLMARYWTLGAACTYQSCERGTDAEWSRFCHARAAELPPCPPVEPASE